MIEFSLNWILLGLPIAFALGWLASRIDLRQLRLENRSAPRAYFRGLNHLLNEQQDEAIDAFIEAVQQDPDTSELHFALGNLFRHRGEYERAVRVHEHLLSRADLSNADRNRAQYALALDFLKAGLLDHAESALLRLEQTPYQASALLALLSVYERMHDWTRASEVAVRLQESGQPDFSVRLAHYRCEQAAELASAHQEPAAEALLHEAMALAPDAGRARIELARLAGARGDAAEAFRQFTTVADSHPQLAPLIATDLVQHAAACSQLEAATQLLERLHDETPSIDLAEALVDARATAGAAAGSASDSYLDHMLREPSLIAAQRWLAMEPLRDERAGPAIQQSLLPASARMARYRCAACGFEATHHFWQCPGCQAWDSYPPRRVEEL